MIRDFYLLIGVYPLFDHHGRIMGAEGLGKFDNLSSSKAGVQNILLGDARLRMEQLPKDTLYDVIVLAAFTGGSVPI